MSMYPEQQRTLDYGYAETGEDGRVLRSFFNNVYLWMSIGLMWTAVVSVACAYTPALRAVMSPGVMIAAAIGAFVLSLATQSIALKVNVVAGLGLFMAYATLIGLIIAPIWVMYPQATIGTAFLLTGGIFLSMSIVGFVTKIDLSRMQSILIMGVWGLLLASVINIFFANSSLSWIVTYAAVVIFTGLIATKTQELKEFALYNNDQTMAGRMAVVGALQLYIAFINIFLSLLRILGDRR